MNKYGLTPECIWLRSFSSLFAQAQKTIATWIDFYNNERQQPALGYLAPVQFRNKQAA